jgi:hypothetical protein
VSFDYTRTSASASRLLARFGAVCTLKRQTAGGYDPTTGTDTVTETTHATVAVVFAYPQKYVDGSLILQGDQQAYMDPGVTPKQGDVLAWNGTDYTVIAVKPVAPAGTVVLFEAQLRG